MAIPADRGVTWLGSRSTGRTSNDSWWRSKSSRLRLPGWFVAVRDEQQDVFDRAGELRTPILALIGGADAIADPNRTRSLFERLGSETKRLIDYPGLFHEVFNEIERGRVVADLLAWLGERTNR